MSHKNYNIKYKKSQFHVHIETIKEHSTYPIVISSTVPLLSNREVVLGTGVQRSTVKLYRY